MTPFAARLRPLGLHLVALGSALSLAACGTPTACLANRYDGTLPQARCVSGIQLPGTVLRDTDPQSSPAAALAPTYLPPIRKPSPP